MPRSDTALRIGVVLATVFAMMVAELVVSRSHERTLRRQGALEPPDDVYWALAWAYPLCFVAMAAEGLLGRAPRVAMVVAGMLVFLGAKALKYWAVFTLGPRWAYRVLVLPGAPLVTGGPYAWVRHPNYLAVVCEIAGVAMIAGAWMTGPAALAAVGALLRKRVAVEDRALGRE